MVKKSIPTSVILIIIVSAVLRFWEISQKFSWGGVEGSFIWDIWYVGMGHPTLIGFESAAVGGLSFPPFLLYFFVPFFWLSGGNPIFIAVILAILGIASTALLFFVGKEIFNERVGVIAALLYAFSSQAVNIDHKFIGGTFIVPVSLLSIFLLWRIYKKAKVKPIDFIVLGSVIGLSFSAHYQAIFLLLATLVFIYFFKKKDFNFKNVLASLVSVFVWFLPLAIFDLRHNFFHLRGFVTLFSSYTHPASESGVLVSGRYILQNIFGLFWQEAYFFHFYNIFVVLTLLCVLLTVFYLFIFRNDSLKKSRPAFFYMVILYIVGFAILSFYRSGDYQFDYYFWYLVPVTILLSAFVLDFFIQKGLAIAAVSVVCLLLFVNFLSFLEYVPSESYGRTLADVEKVISDAKQKNRKELVVRFYGPEAGSYDYLFYWYGKKEGFDPALITLISQREFYQERSILGSGRTPIKILPKGAGSALTPDYVIRKDGVETF